MEYKNNTKNKYILYARKSTLSEDKQVASIQSQINEMAKIAESYSLKVVHIMSEASSGFKVGRKVFNQVLGMIENGEADGILCWKLSRLSRNPDDAGRIMGMLQRAEVNHIRTYSRDWYPEDNVMMMYVEFGITNQFSRDLRDDTFRGLRQKAERGWKPNSALPLGYIHNMGNKKQKGLPEKEILNDPDRHDLVKLGLELVVSRAKTPSQALKHITSLGLRTKKNRKVATSTFYGIMTNTFYYGDFEYPVNSGNWYTGKHNTMLTFEQYKAIQEILGRTTNPRPKIHYFPYTGMMKCGECGCSITAEKKEKTQKNGNKHGYTYYRCTKKREKCSQKSLEVTKLEKQFNKVIENIYIPPEFAEWAIEELKKDFEKEKFNRDISLTLNEKNYRHCLKRIDVLVESWLDGDIPKNIYKNKLANLEKEKKMLEGMQKTTNERVDDWLKKAEKVFNFATHAKEEFEKGTLEKKREIIAYLGSNLILKDRIITIELQKPIEKVKEVSAVVNELAERFEPLALVDNKVKFRASLNQNPVWGG